MNWINVNFQHPPVNDMLLAWIFDGKDGAACFCHYKDKKFLDNQDNEIKDVTHWIEWTEPKFM